MVVFRDLFDERELSDEIEGIAILCFMVEEAEVRDEIDEMVLILYVELDEYELVILYLEVQYSMDEEEDDEMTNE